MPCLLSKHVFCRIWLMNYFRIFFIEPLVMFKCINIVWIPVTHFTKGLQALHWNFVEIFSPQILFLMIQLSCRGMCKIMTWLHYYFICQSNMYFFEIRFGLWASNRFVKQVLVTHFTKRLWAYKWNLLKIPMALIQILIIQSGHKFAHVKRA